MSSVNRDLLVLVKDNRPVSEQEMEHQVAWLHDMLYRVESVDNFCVANELIDLNRFKIIRKPYLIIKAIRQRELKPFQFICNKN